AGDLQHADMVFVGDVSNTAKFVGRGYAATNAGYNREGTILLNIGVDAVVDEARRAVLIMIAAPKHVEDVAQSGLADFAADSISVDCEHLLHALELLATQDPAKLVLGKWNAFADRLLYFFLKLRHNGLQERLAEAGATSASGRSARAFLK